MVTVTGVRLDYGSTGMAALRIFTDPVNVSGHRFRVLRGEEGGREPGRLVDVAGETKATVFMDRGIPDLSLLRRFRYFVQPIEEGSPEVEGPVYGPFFPGADADPLAIEMIRRHEIELQHGGQPVSIHQLKVTASRCPSCWDAIKNTVRFSDCPRCKGSGVLDGYEDPIIILAIMNPRTEQSFVSQRGETERSGVQFRMGPHPHLQTKDVIRTADGMCWRVQNVQRTDYLGTVTHQFATVEAIDRSGSIYDLPMPPELLDAAARRNPS